MPFSPNRNADAGAPGLLDWALALGVHALFAVLWALSWQAPRMPLTPNVVHVRLIAQMPAHTPPQRPRRALPPKKTPAQARIPTRTKPKPKPDIPPAAPLVAPLEPSAASSATDVAPAVSSMAHEATATLSSQEIARYLARMRARIEAAWNPPPGPFARDPEIELRLFPNGRVRAVRILVSSGNEALDASLVRAVYAAAPFPLPPVGYEAFLINRIRFHPRR